jgi:hypothetical protein
MNSAFANGIAQHLDNHTVDLGWENHDDGRDIAGLSQFVRSYSMLSIVEIILSHCEGLGLAALACSSLYSSLFSSRLRDGGGL